MIVIVMGVAGSGKTTVGGALAASLGWRFEDGDALHPAANVEKMRAGIPLTDADRAPWLAALRARIDAHLARGGDAVIACSALKAAYRDTLRAGREELRFVYLKGDRNIIRERLATRRGHFVPPALLESQLATLEEPPPTEAIHVDLALPVDRIVATVRAALGR